MNVNSAFIDTLKRVLAARKPDTVIFTDATLTPASVLVPVFYKEGQYHLLLTKRTKTLEYHKGQICFPGGAQNTPDESPLDTALRETFEEIGVKPSDVNVLGQLDRMSTLTSNFLVTPIVGVIEYPYDFIINRDEIDKLVEIPLDILADEQHYHEEEYDISGIKKKGIVFEYKGKVIWGATARMIKQLVDIIYADKNKGGSHSKLPPFRNYKYNLCFRVVFFSRRFFTGSFVGETWRFCFPPPFNCLFIFDLDGFRL